jgi:DNA-binding beta-propeller fold protein YncE
MVARWFGGDVLILNSSTLQLLKQVPCGKYNSYMVVNPVRNEAYVLGGVTPNENYWDTNVYVLDLKELRVVAKIDLGHPLGVADLSTNGRLLYVTTDVGVTVVDTASRSITRVIPMGSTYPRLVVVHPTNGLLYVADSDSVQVFNASDGLRVSTIGNLTYGVEDDVIVLTLAPRGDRLFSVDDRGLLYVMDTASNRLIGNVSLETRGYGEVGWIYFDTSGDRGYILFTGGVPIDGGGPDLPGLVGFMDVSSLRVLSKVKVSNYAGARQMAIIG